MDAINLLPVKAFSDNYIWLARHDAADSVVIVDPGDAEPVLRMLETLALTPCAILITHHHHDHIGGIPGLLKHFHVPVFGPANSAIPGLTQTVREGDSVELDNGLSFNVLEVPGHTLDHIAYCGHEVVFVGDTLFAGGCGRLFEGSAEQMLQSLHKLTALADDTRVCCAHEYTLRNLEFAREVDRQNARLAERLDHVRQLRLDDRPTLPTTIDVEKKTNPFLRCQDDQVQATAAEYAGRAVTDELEAFKVIRFWKDTR